MPSSLEQVVENIIEPNNEDNHDDFKIMKKFYPEHYDMLCQKGFYAYEFVDSNEKLDDPSYHRKKHSSLTQKELNISCSQIYDII